MRALRAHANTVAIGSGAGQIRFRGLKTHVAHKQVLHASSPWMPAALRGWLKSLAGLRMVRIGWETGRGQAGLAANLGPECTDAI